MSKLWKKNNKKLNPIIERFNIGKDYLFDLKIFPYDIQASKAHAEMLFKIGILKKTELDKLLFSLNKLLVKYYRNKIKISPQHEDCHTVIENFLTKELKSIGKKIHIGRSRNDQVLTALRLYSIDEINVIHKKLKGLIRSFIFFSEKNKKIILPGYTHTQQAMISSVAHWGLSFAESLINDYEILKFTKDFINQNPLGSAAGFGVNIEIDRNFTKKKLNFKTNIINSLFAQVSRGKFESIILEAVCQIMLTLSRFSADVLFFTTRELDYFQIDDALTTGSSIMPQKKNLDALELVRGYNSIIISNQLAIKNISKNLISGYNRDSQLIAYNICV